MRGYLACPNHTEKETLFRLLDAPERIRITLTESRAVRFAAAVSGYYFSHPETLISASAGWPATR